MPTALPNPFCELSQSTDAFPRGFDPNKFFAEIEPAPKFLSNPSPEYLQAAEIMPLLEVLAAY
jgi:hypothetical protein